MKKIRIEIINGHKKPTVASFDLPEAWNEVPADIYPHLASLYLAGPDKMDEYDKTVRSFSILAWQQWPVLEKLEPEELYDLLKLIDWVFNRLDLTRNLQPEIKIDQVYYGPADRMANLRFAEWCAADTFFMDYAESKDETCLHNLAAVLYRPAGTGEEFDSKSPKYRGDIREKYNDQLLDRRTAIMATLPLIELQGIYVFFASCRQQIISEYTAAFPPAKSGDKEDTARGDGWLGIYDDLRGDPKFGGAEKLEEEFLDMVLFSLNRNNIKMRELKEKYDL